MDKEHAQGLISRVLPSFSISGVVGKGSFGAVYKIKDDLKERVVKIVPLSASTGVEGGAVVSADSKIERDFRHIVESYERIACEEIVTVYDFYMVRDDESRETGHAYALIIMEIYPSSLDRFVISHYEKTGRPMDIAVARNVILKVAVMLANLYTKTGFLFEDFKPENILVKEHLGDLKLVVGDIGGLKNIVSIALTASQVTPSYCAPEIIRKAQVPDMRSIIYSYGLLAYFILEGHLPYEDQNFNARFDHIREKGLPFSRDDVPEDLKQIIGNCLSFEAEGRCSSFEEVVQWLRGTPPAQKGGDFSEGTIMVGRGGPSSPAASQGSSDFAASTIAVGGKAGAPAISGGVRELKTPAALKRPALRAARTAPARTSVESVSITDERELLKNVDRDIKGFVVRKGDSFKINNQKCRVLGNIIVEANGVLSLNNSHLFFAENAGIVVMGALRTRDSVISAMDSGRGWNNITMYLTAASGISIMESTRIHFGTGISGMTLKKEFNITRPSIADNGSYGGGLFIAGGSDSNITLKQITFFKTSASEGGGLYLHRSKAGIQDCVFEGCKSKGSGGAVYAFESAHEVNRCTINKCSAARDGGGVACVSSKSVISDSKFTSCICKYHGGGISSISSVPSIVKCRFEKCSSTQTGGGIYADTKSKPDVRFPSFSGCRPDDSNIGM